MCKQKRTTGIRGGFRIVGVLVFSLVLCGSYAWSDITLLDGNYKVEKLAEYDQGLYAGRAKYITADDSGKAYITHDDADLMLVAANGTVSTLATGFNNLQGITWTGGTSFGENLYAAEVDSKSIKKIDSSGTVTTLRTFAEQPLVVEIDRTGNYGNQLYTGTRSSSILYSVSETGSLSEFLNIGALTDGMPFDLGFDTTGRYNGYMYLTLAEVTNPDYQGILSIDPEGNITRISGAGKSWGTHFEFDSTTEQDFYGDLFFGRDTSVKRLTPDGDVVGFLTSDRNIQDYTFGADGAMYIMEDDSGGALGGLVTISKITPIPEPTSLVLLGVGTILASLRRKKR